MEYSRWPGAWLQHFSQRSLGTPAVCSVQCAVRAAAPLLPWCAARSSRRPQNPISSQSKVPTTGWERERAVPCCKRAKPTSPSCGAGIEGSEGLSAGTGGLRLGRQVWRSSPQCCSAHELPCGKLNHNCPRATCLPWLCLCRSARPAGQWRGCKGRWAAQLQGPSTPLHGHTGAATSWNSVGPDPQQRPRTQTLRQAPHALTLLLLMSRCTTERL